MRSVESDGQGNERADCMKQFKAAWDIATDKSNLTAFPEMK
jgi:hypothetical protein